MTAFGRVPTDARKSPGELTLSILNGLWRRAAFEACQCALEPETAAPAAGLLAYLHSCAPLTLIANQQHGYCRQRTLHTCLFVYKLHTKLRQRRWLSRYIPCNPTGFRSFQSKLTARRERPLWRKQLGTANGSCWPVGDPRRRPALRHHTSVCSAISSASSTSIPRYRTVLSSLEWPSSNCTARRFLVRLYISVAFVRRSVCVP
jgi:hypothetical protein